MQYLQAQTVMHGANGHRVVGKIAEAHVSETTKAALIPYLNGESLAQISTWPDEMRSAPGDFGKKIISLALY